MGDDIGKREPWDGGLGHVDCRYYCSWQMTGRGRTSKRLETDQGLSEGDD